MDRGLRGGAGQRADGFLPYPEHGAEIHRLLTLTDFLARRHKAIT